MKTLVMGAGNPLLGDEGVGVHAVRILMQESHPPGTEIIEVDEKIIDILPVFESVGRVILLDAMIKRGSPGTIYRIALKDCRSPACIATRHAVDIFMLLALTGRIHAMNLVVFGVEPDGFGCSPALSSPVCRTLPDLLKAVRKEISKPFVL